MQFAKAATLIWVQDDADDDDDELMMMVMVMVMVMMMLVKVLLVIDHDSYDGMMTMGIKTISC